MWIGFTPTRLRAKQEKLVEKRGVEYLVSIYRLKCSSSDGRGRATFAPAPKTTSRSEVVNPDPDISLASERDQIACHY